MWKKICRRFTKQKANVQELDSHDAGPSLKSYVICPSKSWSSPAPLVGQAKKPLPKLGSLPFEKEPVPLISPGKLEQKQTHDEFPLVGNVGEKAAVASSPKISESKRPEKRSDLESAIATSAVDASTGTSPVVDSIGYWKNDLAEFRRQALEDALRENMILQKELEFLFLHFIDSIGYWKNNVAVSLRQALEDALRENMKLHKELEILRGYARLNMPDMTNMPDWRS